MATFTGPLGYIHGYRKIPLSADYEPGRPFVFATVGAGSVTFRPDGSDTDISRPNVPAEWSPTLAGIPVLCVAVRMERNTVQPVTSIWTGFPY